MNPNSNAEALKELQSDLVRKYKTHASKIDTIWRSFDKNQRGRCLKAGAADGVVLRHSSDISLGNVYKFVPELNLQDISSEPEFLLDHLKHRSTTSLFQQYCEGVHGQPGDRNFILEMMQKKNLRHIDPFKDSYTFFIEERYGDSFKILSEREETLAAFAPAIKAGLCVPQSTGELILQRQLTLLQTYNILIEDILDLGSQTRSNKQRSKKSEEAASAALSKLTIQERPKKLSLPDLISSAQDQKDCLEEFLNILSAEPVVFAHAVNVWFFSRPELVVDDKGRHLPVHTDKYISSALFESIHSAVKGATIWNYICRLLELLKDSATDKVYRPIILQEISNLCHLEYSRAQAHFIRHVQTGIGAKYFRRIANSYDNAGNAKVNMKIQPEELTRVDPQLHYVLRLCQSQTNASKAVEWIKKLSDLYESHPVDRESLQEREIDAFGDLIVITSFIQELSPVISMPALSRKKGQMFVSRSQELDAELNKIRDEIDLRDFAVPIDNLLEPGMTTGALTALDQFVVSKSGSKLGFLYQDLMEECLADLRTQYQTTKAKLDKTEYIPLPTTTPQSVEDIVEQRRHKEKTRPSHSTIFEIIPTFKALKEEPSQPQQVLKVSATVGEVFYTLFEKSETRGSINWSAFEGAMAELGFSVMPKYGSVYTFLPPDSMNVKKSFTVHRPHKSRIEGYLIPIFARRLKRTYGWSESTFKIA
ncbi:ipa protein [Trichoderma arundinaceum]|uniref:Ipa protein n=1 Tax=Trichoderma arundinaceum TaxID=490622 RepID=A0A395NHL0_TRIAR|nr:ipa protein [Trichoderma arundinaceum]